MVIQTELKYRLSYLKSLSKPHFFILFLILTGNNSLFAATPCETAQQLFSNLPDDATERLEVITRTIDLCPTFLNHFERAVAYLELDKPEQALSSLQEAKSLLSEPDPTLFANLHGRFAEAYYKMGDRAKAMAHIDSAHEIMGKDVYPWINELRVQIYDSSTQTAWTADEIQNKLDINQSNTRSFYVTSGDTANPLNSTQNLDIQIHFEVNSAELDEAGVRQVQEIGNALEKYIDEGKTAQIVGHTDVRGTQEYNQRLSEQRAQSVVNQILSVHPNFKAHLLAVGKGESEPRFTENTEQAHKLNRRVEVRLVSN